MDEAKFDALVHYICARCETLSKLGATTLNKILWYSDAGAYLYFGQPITGAAYVKREFGPVPKAILAARRRLIEAGAIVERDALFHGYSQKQFIALKRPDLSRFTADEISLVDSVIDAICEGHTATSISQLTHDHVWAAAQIGEEIPLFTILGKRGEIDEEDVAWARTEMNRIEPNRVAA